MAKSCFVVKVNFAVVVAFIAAAFAVVSDYDLSGLHTAYKHTHTHTHSGTTA